MYLSLYHIYPEYSDTSTPRLPYLLLNLNKFSLLPNVVIKIAGWVAKNVDPDGTLQLWCLIWVYTVCLGLSDQIHTVKYNIW